MGDDRQALHDLVDQAPEQALPHLRAWLTRLLSPSEPPEGISLITFIRNESGATEPEAMSATERAALTAVVDLAHRSDLVEQLALRTLERLGLSRESLGRPTGQTLSGTADGFWELQCDWQAGSRRHRLSTLYMVSQEVITFVRAEVSEDGAELNYQIRVLTPAGEEAGEFPIPLFPNEPRSQ